MKQFLEWHVLKEKTNINNDCRLFQDREVWWCRIGMNIGHEENGKGKEFERPVVIFKKFNRRIFIGIPLTSQPYTSRFYSPIHINGVLKGYAILSQLRIFDSKRLINKMGIITKDAYLGLKKAVSTLLCE